MRSNFIPVKGNPNLVRDRNSGAILNINKNEIEAARKRKQLRKQQDQEMMDLKQEVASIKEMLSQIIEKL